MSRLTFLRSIRESLRAGGDARSDSFVASALPKIREAYVDHFPFKGQNENSKAKVQSRNVTIESGNIILDPSDVQEVLTISSDLNLDELIALDYLDQAHSLVGEATAEAALGVFFEERIVLLDIILELFKIQALGFSSVSDALYGSICDSNQSLLQQGGQAFVTHLLSTLEHGSLEARAGSRLVKVITPNSQLQDRHVHCQKERLLLAECLFYVSTVAEFSAKEISTVMDLAQTLARRMEGLHLKDAVICQQTSLLVATLLQSLSSAQGDEAESSQQSSQSHLAVLARNQELAGRFEANEVSSVVHAAAQLAWGLLLDTNAPPTYRARSAACIDKALQCGALRCLRGLFFGAFGFEDPLLLKKLADLLNHLCLDFLDCESYEQVASQLLARSHEIDDRGELNNLDAVLLPSECLHSQRDGLHTLLLLMADIHSAVPELWLTLDTRNETFSSFMQDAVSDGLLSGSPSILMTYLKVLEALAKTEPGSRAMFSQLQQSKESPLSWQRVMATVQYYCRRYSAGHQQVQTTDQGKGAELVISDRDALALCSYLQLLTTILKTAAKSDFDACITDLEQLAQLKPVWPLFLQLMCHPVPQILKASLDNLLAAFLRQAEDAEALMRRMLLCVIVQPNANLGATSGLTTADLAFQLHEIEEQIEDYSESLAFIRLLNTMYNAFGGRLPDDGQALQHYTEFVRSEVIGQMNSRAFRNQRQKWDVLCEALVHMRLCLEAFQNAGSVDTFTTSPAFVVFTDLWGGRQCWRACADLMLQEPQKVAEFRANDVAGRAKEAAVKAALNLLDCALQMEDLIFDTLKARPINVRLEPLESILKRDARLVGAVLGFVQYPYSSSIQVAAIKIAQHLVVRLPNLVDSLLADSKEGALPGVQLAAGFADCFQQHLVQEQPDSDNPAKLILELLIFSLRQPAPSLAHLLLGYSVDGGLDGLQRSVLDPQMPFSCLTVLLQFLQHCSPWHQPEGLPSMALEIFLELASNPLTRDSILELLRKVEVLPSQLITLSDGLPDQGLGAANCMQYVAYLLQLCAIELHHADAAVPAHHASVLLVLKQLFDPACGGDSAHPTSNILSETLRSAVLQPLQQPDLSAELPGPLKSHSQKLGVQNLLRATLEGDETSSTPTALYNISHLSQILQDRLQQVSEDERRFGLSESQEQYYNVCTATLRYAQQWNSYLKAEEVRLQLITAWQYLVEVAFYKRFSLLATEVLTQPSGEDAIQTSLHSAVSEILDATLDAAGGLASDSRHLLPYMMQVVRLGLARLKDSAAMRGQGVQGGETLSDLRQTLNALLSILMTCNSVQGRLPVYGSILDLLSIHSLLLRHGVDDSSSMSQSQQVTFEIAHIISEAVQRSKALGVLTEDAAGLPTNTVARVLALRCLAQLVSCSAAISDQLFTAGFPQHLLAEMLHLIDKIFIQVRNPAKEALQVVCSQASLLLAIVQATARSSSDSARLRMSSLKIIPALTACQALNMQPEDSVVGSQVALDSLRDSLDKLFLPLLMLVVASLYRMPQGRQVSEAAAGFAESHHKSLLRIMREASDSNSRSWPPRPVVQEQAALVLQILAKAAGMEAHMPHSSASFHTHAFHMLQTYSSPANDLAVQAKNSPQQNKETLLAANSQEERWLEIQVGLAVLFRQLTAQGNSSIVFEVSSRKARQSGAGLPSLQLLIQFLKQVGRDLIWAVKEEQAQTATASYGLGAANKLKKVNMLSLTTENVIAIFLAHLAPGMGAKADTQAVELLRKELNTELNAIIRTIDATLSSAWTSSIQHMAHKLKDAMIA